MKYTKYDKLIDESYPEERQAVYEKLKKELGLPDDTVAPAESRSADTAAEKPASKWRIFLKKPACLAACVSAATAVVCLAIILPFTLNNDGGLQATMPNPTPNPPQTSVTTDRFIKAEECEEIEIEYSIKEYSELNNLSLLYIDWYDMAEFKTSLHVDNEDSTDIAYFEEIMMHKGTGAIVELYITDLRTAVDKVEEYKKSTRYAYVTKYPYTTVFWGVGSVNKWEPYRYQAFFKYENYIYTLVLKYTLDENEIFDLIDSMLPKKR